MLKFLQLESLSDIAGRQRIDFAPPTFLFGANSAGKSTVLQALLYLHEVPERGSAEVDCPRTRWLSAGQQPPIAVTGVHS